MTRNERKKETPANVHEKKSQGDSDRYSLGFLGQDPAMRV